MQTSFFDLDNRHQKLNERDAMIWLDQVIVWEDFRKSLMQCRTKPKKSNAGRKPFDIVMMFKALVLQNLYNLGDDEIEFQIRDRYSFCRSLKLSPEDRVPDAKTLWLFREQLAQQSLVKVLFNDFNLQLQDKGFKAQKGQIIDASFISAPIQRKRREDNAFIKQGGIPKRFDNNPNIKRQKNCDACWTKKNDQKHYGCKDYIAIDNAHKQIRDYEVTSAEVHDS